MLNRKTQLLLTDLMQSEVTDLDIYREKPFVFNQGKLLLVVKPVSFREHDLFLKDMARLILEFYEIFNTLDFLNSYNYKEEKAVSTLIQKISIFTAEKSYSKFKKRSIEFVTKWAYITRKKKVVKLKHNKGLCKKFLKDAEPSEFIYILFLLFVMNFDIVKKNTIHFMEMFRKDITIESSTQTDTLSPGISTKVVVMPKYSPSPYDASTLNLLEQQSKK